MKQPKTRWIEREQGEGRAPDVDAFLADIEALSRKHGLAISHEDGHGAFLVVSVDQFDFSWLHAAHDAR